MRVVAGLVCALHVPRVSALSPRRTFLRETLSKHLSVPAPATTEEEGKFHRYWQHNKDMNREVPAGFTLEVKRGGPVAPFRFEDEFGQNVAIQKAIEYGPAKDGSCPGNQKVGLMIAGNSGLPGGKIGKSWTKGLDLNFKELQLPHSGQEESCVQSWIIATMLKALGTRMKETLLWPNKDLENVPKELKNLAMDKSAQAAGWKAFRTIFQKWGFKTVKSNENRTVAATDTIQGVNFQDNGKVDGTKDMNVYRETFVVKSAPMAGIVKNSVKGPYAIAPYYYENAAGLKIQEPSYNPPQVDLVFVSGPQASTSDGDTMSRTFCEACANDFKLFQEGQKNALRGALDAMILEGHDVAVVAGISTDIYAGRFGKHNIRWNPNGDGRAAGEFPTLLRDVLEENILEEKYSGLAKTAQGKALLSENPKAVIRRWQMFKEVLYPKLGEKAGLLPPAAAGSSSAASTGVGSPSAESSSSGSTLEAKSPPATRGSSSAASTSGARASGASGGKSDPGKISGGSKESVGCGEGVPCSIQ